MCLTYIFKTKFLFVGSLNNAFRALVSKIHNIFFYGDWCLNFGLCIYYTLSLSTELNSRRQDLWCNNIPVMISLKKILVMMSSKEYSHVFCWLPLFMLYILIFRLIIACLITYIYFSFQVTLLCFKRFKLVPYALKVSSWSKCYSHWNKVSPSATWYWV